MMYSNSKLHLYLDSYNKIIHLLLLIFIVIAVVVLVMKHQV